MILLFIEKKSQLIISIPKIVRFSNCAKLLMKNQFVSTKPVVLIAFNIVLLQKLLRSFECQPAFNANVVVWNKWFSFYKCVVSYYSAHCVKCIIHSVKVCLMLEQTCKRAEITQYTPILLQTNFCYTDHFKFRYYMFCWYVNVSIFLFISLINWHKFFLNSGTVHV